MSSHSPSGRPRIAIAGIIHESNSFSSRETTLADFEQSSVTRGDEVIAHWSGGKHEVSGFIQGARENGVEPRPILVATATPSGPVEASTWSSLAEEVIQRIGEEKNLDGILVALHGAMFAEDCSQPDAEILRRIRHAVGEEMPIVATHDFHANVCADVVRACDVLVGYQENPHVDQYARGMKAAGIMARIVRRQVNPVSAIAQPPMIFNIRHQNTSREPLAAIVAESRRLERDPRILAATVFAGFQYADVPAMGPSVVVVADGDRGLAMREAERLSQMLWNSRERLVLDVPDAATAVSQAIQAARFPAALVDMGDNIGGGSAGDGTTLLYELMRQNACGWLAVIADEEAVRVALDAGPGGLFQAEVGGKTDDRHGSPIFIRGKVKSLHNGEFLETEVRHGGIRYGNQGLTAVVEAEGSTPDLPNLLVLTSRRQPPFSLQPLISCGINPARQHLIVVKAAIAFRAAYEPVVSSIIEVDTPGLTAINPSRFAYTQVRRPLFGLDQGVTYRPAVSAGRGVSGDATMATPS